jgi:transposase
MINLTNASLKIYLALQPTDMRKSFNGLAEIATEHLGQELVKGAIFAFTNKRRNRLKLLYFDGTGLWVAAKRLEAGTFSWPSSNDARAKKLKLAPQALQLLLDGIDLKGASMRGWYQIE